MTWTKQQVEVLKEFLDQGKAIAYISHELDKSPAAVQQKIWRLGLHRSPNAVDHTAVRKLAQTKLSEQDIASRIAALLGEGIKPEVEAKSLTDEDLLRFVDGTQGLKTFLGDLCSIELQDYQVQICEKLLGQRNCIIISGRQAGKDLLIACFVLWESITKANSRILIVSAAQRQSDLLNTRILAFIAGNDKLYASVEKAGREELRFKNSSSIFFLPATGLIRGYTEVTRVVVNEARDVDELAYDAITPTLARKGGSLGVFSTPLGRAGKLWELWNSPMYEKIGPIPSSANKYLDTSFLEAERDRMSNSSYRCEYLGEFVASEENYFDPSSIQKAALDYNMSLQAEEGMRYSIGCDWGRRQDASVMLVLAGLDPNCPWLASDGPETIGRKDGVIHAVPAEKPSEQRPARMPTAELKVQFIKSFDGVSFDDQVAYVEYLAHTFRPFRIVAEETGLGMGPCDSLKKRLGMLIEPFKTTNASKIEIYGLLRTRFDRGEMTIPLEPLRLKRELELLEYETLPSGAVRIGHPSGEHDDFPDALALASWAFKPQPKVFRIIVQNVGEPWMGRSGSIMRY